MKIAAIQKRYSFWKTFWVILTLYVLLITIGIIVAMMVPGEGYKMADFLSARTFIKTGISTFAETLYFFIALNIFNHLFVQKKDFWNFLPALLLSIIVVFGYHLLMDHFFPPKKPAKEVVTQGIMYVSYAVASVFLTGIALLLAYLNNLRDERKQRKVLEAQKLQLEVEKSQANLNFLKAQINPHFLHNTLNFLYAKSLPYSQELSEGILTLSDIMRYALSEGAARDGKAPLKDEIEHVRNVIKINQLRFSNNLNVKFEVNGVVNDTSIIPFVLITIVENAFKHGDLKSTEHPIEIQLTINGKRLEFYCRNKKKSGPKELSTGIGLTNIRNRLDLAYGKDYLLQIKDVADTYTTELIITAL